MTYVESFCQTLISADELLSILNKRYVDIRNKTALVQYLVTAYMKSGRTDVQSGVDHLPHDSVMWKHIKIIWSCMKKVINHHQSSSACTIQTWSTVDGSEELDIEGVKHYLFEGGLLLVEVTITIGYIQNCF